MVAETRQLRWDHGPAATVAVITAIIIRSTGFAVPTSITLTEPRIDLLSSTNEVI